MTAITAGKEITQCCKFVYLFYLVLHRISQRSHSSKPRYDNGSFPLRSNASTYHCIDSRQEQLELVSLNPFILIRIQHTKHCIRYLRTTRYQTVHQCIDTIQ